MQLTVKQMAAISGVSARTLRYYDSIGLLRPSRTASGYRVYGRHEVDTLQQILLYRDMGVPLELIDQILRKPGFDRLRALHEHREHLLGERERIEALLANVESSITAMEGGKTMSEQEKFAGFKRARIEQNEADYGSEIRERWGDEAVDASNARIVGMDEEEYGAFQETGALVLSLLDKAFEEGNPRGGTALEAAEAHKRWLCFTWASYSPQAHRALAEMYVQDPRFTAYYDRGVPGRAAFLCEALLHYLQPEENGA